MSDRRKTFEDWTWSVGLVFFERGHSVNGRDTYADREMDMLWRLWEDVAEGKVKP